MADGEGHREFVALLDAHGAALAALLRRLCGNQPDADDAFQETAARIWRHRANGRPVRNPRAWVLTVGYRAFADARGRRRGHEEFADRADAATPGPDQSAERAEARDRVRAAVAALPESVREVVVLHYEAGLTLRETAAAMNLSEGTVKSRLNAALARLRRVIE